MNGLAHRLSTKKAFDILKSINSGAPLLNFADIIANECAETDNYLDLEFVDVEGGLDLDGKDNPHEDEFLVIEDEPHMSYKDNSFTAFNHFIDIKKGAGIFDDYDGYSYRRGSAHTDQYQTGSDAATSDLEEFVGDITGKMVDEGINWWYNDEYVHVVSDKWYQNCSISTTDYSFPQDKGKYPNVIAELADRFPLANVYGGTGKGIPYSVFMPVDNLARYWYDQFLKKSVPKLLGPVLHAIHDASIIHHAAGYMGNWHSNYESEIDNYLSSWINEAAFNNEIKDMLVYWSSIVDPNPPTSLGQNDWQRTPAQNWRIDMLVTWVALNAYREYAQTYNHFKNGYKFDVKSAKRLTKLAIAVSSLVLKNADEYTAKDKQLAFNYNTVSIKNSDGRWLIVDGGRRILDFGVNQEGAKRAYQIIRYYHMNSKVMIGNINNPAMTYFLVNGEAPSGPFNGEDAIPFDPAKLEVKELDGRWKIVDEHGNVLLDFGSVQFYANMGLYFIKKHGFRYICYVGRPNAPMVYFRK